MEEMYKYDLLYEPFGAKRTTLTALLCRERFDKNSVLAVPSALKDTSHIWNKTSNTPRL